MVTIVRLSDKTCFLCANKEDTVEVRFKDRTFSGVVCKEHLFQLLKKKGGHTTSRVEKRSQG